MFREWGNMLETRRHLQATTSDAQRDVVQRQIDALVYVQFGLSEAEVAVVERRQFSADAVMD
jgi:hypothetical protein